VFNQSRFPDTPSWPGSSIACAVGWLNRMTQFKDKPQGSRGCIVGLYDYPVLMAADILVYRATHVRSAKTRSSISNCRAICAEVQQRLRRLDRGHASTTACFSAPEPVITDLRRGDEPARRHKKMSKSDASDNSRINLTDDADTIAQKIRSKDDPEPLPSEEKGLGARPRPKISSASMPHCRRSKQEVLTEFGGGQFSSFKNALVKLAFQNSRDRLGDEAAGRRSGHVDSILIDGADRAGRSRPKP